MRLSRDTLRNLIISKNLVTGYHDLDGQLTANGIDLRLAGLIEITHAGRLAINKVDNINPKVRDAYVLESYADRVKPQDISGRKHIGGQLNNFVKLKQFSPYFAITCEEVNIPSNLMLDITARSSLFRLTQSSLLCTFGEAGYSGYLTFLLIPFLDTEIELGVRFSQIAFSQLDGDADYQKQREANYQGGKLF